MKSNNKPLANQICIVTGANTGIGKVTAMSLAQNGAHVFLACRNQSKTLPVVEEIKAATGSEVEFLPLDLANLTSVREAAAEFLARGLPLHILVNNAGIAGSRGLTQDGFESAFGVNHLGPFLFTKLLLDSLKASAPSRVVNVASKSHYDAKTIHFDRVRQSTRSFTGLPEYAESKLANVLFSAELARQLEGTGVSSYSLHPGVVASDIWHRLPRPFRNIAKHFMLSVEDGAKTSIHCASAPASDLESGLYYDSCATRSPSGPASDRDLATSLWKRSEAWVLVVV